MTPTISRSVLIAFMLIAVQSVASAQVPKPEVKRTVADWNKDRFAFDMHGKTWPQVIEWFVDQTGMPFRSAYPIPNGKFNFIPPKDPRTGKLREYTLAEIYDTINEILLSECRFTLYRLERTLTMMPADGSPRSLTLRVGIHELSRLANTERVEIVTDPLPDGQDAEKIAPEVKRMLGPFGAVTPLTVSNRLIMQADVKSLRLVLDSLQPDKAAQVRQAVADWSQKRVAFEMRGKPWPQVIEWFVDQTGMPYRSKYGLPKGSFNFITPKDAKTGKPREYTISEIFDLINESLVAEHNLLLVRSDTTLSMVPADEPVPPKLIRRVPISELKNLGRTEIVEVVVPMRGPMNSDEMAQRFRGGRATGIMGHTLMLTADPRSIMRFLDELEESRRAATGPPTPPPAAPPPPAAAGCESARHSRPGLLGRLLRR